MIDQAGFADSRYAAPHPIGSGGRPAGPAWKRDRVHVVAKTKPGPRLLLWVDAVGGFLVCLGDEIVLGQAVPHAAVDVPILGDLSRRHAKIRRVGEEYLIKPMGRVWVQGREIESATLLADGDEIRLGGGVRLRFRQPHPLSATARLDFLSRHPVSPSADAVILMAESCVLGPQTSSHVVCRDWTGDVVLFRQGGGLYCRAREEIEIDGKHVGERGPIGPSSRVAGNEFSLCLEPLRSV